MGILNVTPDSFSDGGKFLDPKRAIAQAERMIADGADIIDIGAESTRPYGGQLPVSADEEISRLRPVLKDVVALGTPVSIDTMKPSVARFALDAGASIVNDVWGLQRDGDMARIVATYAVPVVAMHNRETVDPAIDIMGDIADFFARTLAIADKAGIARETDRSRPRHWLRQGRRAKHDGAGAAVRIARIWLPASGRRVAQALHRFGDRLRAASAPRRFAGCTSPGRAQRRCHHPRA